MENNRLSVFVLLSLAIGFPEYGVYFVVGALLLEMLKRYKGFRFMETCDKQSQELLFRLVSYKSLNENIIAEEMDEFSCFQKFSEMFTKTSKLEFPKFGWKSATAAMAVKSALDTGNNKVITNALKLISSKEKSLNETKSLLAAQKYTLIASIGVSSAILGIAALMSGQTYLYYVVAQAMLSAIWLKFLGSNLYESLSLSIPISLVGYFLALRFV